MQPRKTPYEPPSPFAKTFQILNSVQSMSCKLGLLIIKVLKALLRHVPKSSASPKSMTKLTPNEPAITNVNVIFPKQK